MIVIFDMDGVLVDSTNVSLSILTSYYNSIGIKADETSFLPYRGRGQEVLLSGYARSLNIDFNLKEAADYYFSRYEELINEKDVALLGVHSFIKMLKNSNITIAIASSAPTWRVLANLKAIGYKEDDFTLVLSAKDVQENKPSPAIYNLAIEKLNGKLEEVYIVEDSLSGLKAGLGSGANVIAVLTSETLEDVKKLGVKYITPSLDCIKEFSTLDEFKTSISDLAVF